MGKANIIRCVLLSICAAFVGAAAQQPFFYGGSNEMSYINLLGGASRASGLGNSFIALSDDIFGICANPAGLADLVKAEFGFSGNLHQYTTKINAYTVKQSTITKQEFESSGNSIDCVNFAFPMQSPDIGIVLLLNYQRKICYNYSTQLSGSAMASLMVTDRFEVTNELAKLDIDMNGGLNNIRLGAAFRYKKLFRGGLTVNTWFGKQSQTKKVDWTITSKYATPGFPFTTELQSHEKETEKIKLSNLSGGYNFNITLGTLFSVNDRLNIGLAFEIPAHLNYTKSYEKSSQSFDDKTKIDSTLSYTESSKMMLPATIGFGLSYKLKRCWNVAADFNFSNWSEAKVIGGRRFYYNDETKLIVDEEYPTSDLQTDMRRFSIGTEYVLLYKNFIIPLRTGFFHHNIYYKDNANKTIHYNGFSLGAGVGLKDIMIELAWQNQMTTSQFFVNADRNVHSNQIFLSLLCRFDPDNLFR